MTAIERLEHFKKGMELARDAFWRKALETNQIVVVEENGQIVELPARETQYGRAFSSQNQSLTSL